MIAVDARRTWRLAYMHGIYSEEVDTRASHLHKSLARLGRLLIVVMLVL